MRHFLWIGLLALATSCAGTAATSAPPAAVSGTTLASTTPQNVRKANEPETRWVCEMVRPVGSMLPEQQCREVRRMNAERQAAQDFVRQAGRLPGKPSN